MLIGGLVAGLLDLLFALTFAGTNGVGPVRLLQVIASGWLGEAAFTGGPGAAALGLASHFALALLWAALFFVAAKRWRALAVHPLAAGLAFGVVVFLAMRLVVLPLSAYPRPVTFKPLATALDLASHMLLFGLPIAFAARRALVSGRDARAVAVSPA
jgi:uncharacterized membrane protein YagU involved in acid resistance